MGHRARIRSRPFQLRDMPKDERWTAALPDLLNDFSALLRDALDLMRELGGVDSRSDHTYCPSTIDFRITHRTRVSAIGLR
jgi:hypothetical protein